MTATAMRKTFIQFLFVLVICLIGLLLPVFSQTNTRRRTKPSGFLYQVNSRDSKSGEKRIGFVDKTGKLVIGFDRLPKSTVGAGEFRDGLAVIYVRKEGANVKAWRNITVGFIDPSGAVVIPPRLDSARDFSEGLAYVEVDEEEFKGFIDREGKQVIKLSGRRANDFHDGLAAAEDSEPNKWGYVSRTGTWAISPKFAFADDFAEGLAGVVLDGKYGFINRKGEIVIPPRFDLQLAARHPQAMISSGRFKEGLACVRLNGFYGYINKSGAFVIPPQFHVAQDFSEGLAFAVDMDRVTDEVKRAGWIDKFGRWVVTGVEGRIASSAFPRLFTDPNGLLDWGFSEGLVPFLVYVKGKPMWGYMDKKGKVRIEPGEYESVGPFVGGVARIKLKYTGSDESYGYIDKQGRFIWRTR